MLNSRRSLSLLLASNALASVGTGVAMIAIPWLLASQHNGLQLFSILAAIVNTGLFMATPFIGPVIDSGSRRGLMLCIRGLFVACLGIIAILYSISGQHQASLILYYITGSIFYCLNIPLRSAYVQELFSSQDYSRVNAILEVENQVAAAITGMIAIFAIAHYGLPMIIFGNALLYILAMICIVAIPAPRNPAQKATLPYFQSLAAGVSIAAQRPSLSVMLVSASIPYVVVILFTVLHPVALASLNDTSGSTYAIVETLFAIGSIMAGVSASLLEKICGGAKNSMLIALSIFSATVLLQAVAPNYWGFIVLAVGLGLGNAWSRILRQTLLMNGFQSHEAGRMAAFLQSMIMLMRAVFMMVISIIIDNNGVQYGLWFTALIAITSPSMFIIANAKHSKSAISHGVI